MKKTILLILFIAISTSCFAGSDYGALQKRLSYLNEIDEVAWVHFDKNNVYVGFNPLPHDYKFICQAAAFQGNKALNFGVHVWAVPSDDQSWKQGNTGRYFCTTTARGGKVTKPCR